MRFLMHTLRGELLVMLAMVLAIFAYTCHARAPYIGTLSDYHHQWLTASTVKFVENWQEDGFINDGGITLDLPKTIDRQYIKDRAPYVSYPSGSTIPVYLLKLALPDAPTLLLVHCYNLFNQLAVSLVIAAIAYHAAAGLRTLAAAASATIYLLHPMTLYWHSMVYFADQAIMLPFALSLLLELLIRQRPEHARRHLLLLQSVVLTWASFTDWLAVFLIMVLGMLRLLSPLNAKLSWKYLADTAFQLGTGPFLAMLVWIRQVYAANAMGFLRWNFGLRTADANFSQPWQRFVQLFGIPLMLSRFTNWDAALLRTIFAFALVRFALRRRDPASSIVLAAILTPILTCFFFVQHTIVHDFTTLKFILPLALVGYGLMPALLISWLSRRFPNHSHLPLAAAALLCVVCIWGNHTYYNMWRVFYPRQGVYHAELATWLRTHATFNDVYISRDFAINPIPPQRISISRRPVYTFGNAAEQDKFIRATPATAHFHGIMAKKNADLCGVRPSDAQNILTSEGMEWLVVPLSLQSADTLKTCLTLTGK